MFTIKGKYNSANIMLPNGTLDETTTKQIYGFLNNPAFGNTYIAVMPDCHFGAGACIGYTQKMNGYIIPNIVGVDLGCGVLSINLGEQKIDLKKLDNYIRENIPYGFNVNAKAYHDSGYSIKIKMGELKDNIKRISDKIESDGNRNVLALGSLGGGNHFEELGKDEKGNTWLTVHTGSRKFGLDIAGYHQNIAKKNMKEMFIGDAHRGLEFLTEKTGANDYMEDMKVAQLFADTNRMIIAKKIIVDYLKLDLTKLDKINTVHNYINFEDNIIRKGAISAHKDERLVIPFNMEDGLIIGVGKGNSKWNYSAPHGAGRVLSRTKAKKELNLKDMEDGMKRAGVYTTSLSAKTLDEAKGAYKNKALILTEICETVDVTHYVKPIYNFKSDN